jgi:DNA-binding transcriptional MerR regulator
MNFDIAITRSELARALDVDRTTLWNWEQAGLIPAPERVSGNRSIYSPAAQMTIAARVEASR